MIFAGTKKIKQAMSRKTKENNLFMAYYGANDDESRVWFVDSGCSNHMSGTRSMFKEIDESQRKHIRLGDNKQIQVEGKGTVVVETDHGQVRLLHNVFFIPSLAHNLLSVGQLMNTRYSILFYDGSFAIRDKKIWSNFGKCTHDRK